MTHDRKYRLRGARSKEIQKRFSGGWTCPVCPVLSSQECQECQEFRSVPNQLARFRTVITPLFIVREKKENREMFLGFPTGLDEGKSRKLWVLPYPAMKDAPFPSE
jgi:hypothetical protein